MSNKRDREDSSVSSDSYGSDYYSGKATDVEDKMQELLQDYDDWKAIPKRKGKKKVKCPVTWEKMSYLLKKWNLRRLYRQQYARVHLRHIKRQKLRQEAGKPRDDEQISDEGSDRDYCSDEGPVELRSEDSGLTDYELQDMGEGIGEDMYSVRRHVKESDFGELLEWMRTICKKPDFSSVKPAMREIPPVVTFKP